MKGRCKYLATIDCQIIGAQSGIQCGFGGEQALTLAKFTTYQVKITIYSRPKLYNGQNIITKKVYLHNADKNTFPVYYGSLYFLDKYNRLVNFCSRYLSLMF